MSKRRGGYLGGSTLVRASGVHTARGSHKAGRITSVGPEHEKRKREKLERDKETQAAIKANEKLILKLGKKWREGKAVRSFAGVSAKPNDRDARTKVGALEQLISGKSLAVAFQEAFAKGKLRR